MGENENILTCENSVPSIENYTDWGVETDIYNLPQIDPKRIAGLGEKEAIHLLHSEEEVLNRIQETAGKISHDYKDIRNLAVLIVMNGGKRYGEELINNLPDLNPLAAYVRLKSYTDNNEVEEVKQLTPIYTIETKPNGERIKVPMEAEEIVAKRWLIADDVLDTSGTIRKGRSILGDFGVALWNIRTTTLCNKNSPDLVDYPCFLAYHGFWLVGANMGRGDDFTKLPTGPLSIGVYTEN